MAKLNISKLTGFFFEVYLLISLFVIFTIDFCVGDEGTMESFDDNKP